MEPETPIEPAGRLPQLERRLQVLGKICRHDLPNKLVIIRGLLNLLLEESGKLGAEGQDYIRRLSGAVDRALDMMQSLKTLLAVDVRADKPEEIDLDDLARELIHEIRQLFPRAEIDCQLSLMIRKVKWPRRTLHRALVELLRYGLAGRNQAVVELGSRPMALGVEIALAIARDRILLDPAVLASSSGNNKALESRLELLVVRELLETGGGAVRFVETPGQGLLYVLSIPSGQG